MNQAETIVLCPLCTRAMSERFAFRTGIFQIFRCDQCDLERANPIPSQTELNQVYGAEYFNGQAYKDYFAQERAVIDEKARVRMDALERYGLKPNSTILELGCADGRFLEEAHSRGHQVMGVEGSAAARSAASETIAPKIESTLKALTTQAWRWGSIDVFAAFDVLEHLRDPFEDLRDIKRLLNKRALIAVVVPVIDTANARYWPRTWDQYKPPEHLWYFSVQSLAMTLKRTLGATILSAQSAWRRPSRFLHSWLKMQSYHPLVNAEARCWEWLVARKYINPSLLEDSVLMIAEVGGDR